MRHVNLSRGDAGAGIRLQTSTVCGTKQSKLGGLPGTHHCTPSSSAGICGEEQWLVLIAESVTKTKKAVELLKKLGAIADVEKAKVRKGEKCETPVERLAPTALQHLRLCWTQIT